MPSLQYDDPQRQFIDVLRRDVGLSEQDVRAVLRQGGVRDMGRLQDFVALDWHRRECSPDGAARLDSYLSTHHTTSPRGSSAYPHSISPPHKPVFNPRHEGSPYQAADGYSTHLSNTPSEQSQRAAVPVGQVTPPHLGNRATGPDTRSRAGVSSEPRMVGKKMGGKSHAASPRPAQRSDLYGDVDCVFQKGGAGPNPGDGKRRPLGVRKAHVLPGDYMDRTYARTSDDIGGGVGFVAAEPMLNHDARLSKHERDDTDGTSAGWAPPGGWMKELPHHGFHGVLPADSGVMFDTKGKFGARVLPAKRQTLMGGDEAVSPHAHLALQQGEMRDRNTRPRTRLPADIPCRPPGCGTGSTAPSRHLWKEIEETPITAVVDPHRPSQLPRKVLAPSKPVRQVAAAYAIFGDDPFSPVAKVTSMPRSVSPHSSPKKVVV